MSEDGTGSDNQYTLRLSKRELDVAREALAAEACATGWSDDDIETIEAVIARLEALGASGGKGLLDFPDLEAYEAYQSLERWRYEWRKRKARRRR